MGEREGKRKTKREVLFCDKCSLSVEKKYKMEGYEREKEKK